MGLEGIYRAQVEDHRLESRGFLSGEPPGFWKPSLCCCSEGAHPSGNDLIRCRRVAYKQQRHTALSKKKKILTTIINNYFITECNQFEMLNLMTTLGGLNNHHSFLSVSQVRKTKVLTGPVCGGHLSPALQMAPFLHSSRVPGIKSFLESHP